jgi:deoxycytidylate deaminase
VIQSDEASAGRAAIARQAATNSTCVRAKVGAALFNPSGLLVRVGWNLEEGDGATCENGGCPRGRKTIDELPHYSPYHDCVAVHAEVMVLRDYVAARWVSFEGFALYVTHAPCADCASYISENCSGLRVWSEQ